MTAHHSPEAVVETTATGYPKMAATFEMIFVPPNTRAATLQSIVAFLRASGLTVVDTKTQTQPGVPLNYASNNVMFVGPEFEDAWIGVMGWPSELGIEFFTWHMSNPVSAHLSRAVGLSVHLWTYNAGTAAGCCVFKEGNLVELRITGDLLGKGESESRGENVLADLLKDKGFCYQKFMGASCDFELSTAEIANRLGHGVILADVMDMVDGEGGITLESGKLRGADLFGWTGVEYR